MSAAGAAGGAGLDVDEVFSAYIHQGVGGSTDIDIDNGIDLSTEGGLLWSKPRDDASGHILLDTERYSTPPSTGGWLSSNSTAAESTSGVGSVTTWNTDGFTVKSSGVLNFATQNNVFWTFRKAPKFFDVVTYTGTGANRTISHNLNSDVGFMAIKRRDTTGSWACFHRSLNTTSGEKLNLNSSNALSTNTTFFNSTAPTSTEFTVGTSNNTNASGGTYVAYLFAHNDGDGEFGPNADQDIIKCGTYTGNNSADGPTIDLGFEPQFVFVRRAGTTFGGNWYTFDQSRAALTAIDTNDLYLRFDDSGTEDGSLDYISLRPDGFQVHGTSGHTNTSDPYVYMAIRRGPLAEPTSVTDVFDATAYTANNTDGRIITTGNKVDLLLARNTNNTSSFGFVVGDRVRGSYLANQFSPKYLGTASSAAEGSDSDGLMGFDYPSGFAVGNDSTRRLNYSSYSQIAYTWTRAPSFCDIVCYTGNGTAGRTVSHNLGVAPEMIWVKQRNTSQSWQVYHSGMDATAPEDYYMQINSTAAKADNANRWNDTAPTSSVFTLGSGSGVNGSPDTYIAYLFATLAGISKVGSFSHTNGGGDTNVDCGFSNGSKLVIVKNVDATANWFVWDSERGIVSGNESYLKLNDTTSEISADFIDPLSSGFTMTSSFGNVGLNNYVFYAIAA